VGEAGTFITELQHICPRSQKSPRGPSRSWSYCKSEQCPTPARQASRSVKYMQAATMLNTQHENDTSLHPPSKAHANFPVAKPNPKPYKEENLGNHSSSLAR
jgi:hypothetical protein